MVPSGKTCFCVDFYVMSPAGRWRARLFRWRACLSLEWQARRAPLRSCSATTQCLDARLHGRPMRARNYHNETLLPDGTVLVTGGGRTTGAIDLANAVYEAELWNPVTEAFTTLAPMHAPRLYHSIACC
jgi:hypothetical protein